MLAAASAGAALILLFTSLTTDPGVRLPTGAGTGYTALMTTGAPPSGTDEEQREALAGMVLAAHHVQDGDIHPRAAAAVAMLMDKSTDPGCAAHAVRTHFAALNETEDSAQSAEAMIDLLAGDLTDRLSATALEALDGETLSALRNQVVALHAEPYRQLLRLGSANNRHALAQALEGELISCAGVHH